jgi:A/G-specific adenine glycosylase
VNTDLGVNTNLRVNSKLTGEQRRVLQCAESGLRDLPWRRTRDPWAVLVAEVMLQQTQVARAEQRWVAFLQRFPTTAACAEAPLSDLLEEWSGLGYPRRARNLQLTAIQVESNGGVIPNRLEDLLTLPGVGPYTARAVLAFAFEQDAAIVDTNLGRILARRAGRPLGRAEAQAQADAWLPSGQSWAWNQALLDIGALRCRPQAPVCTGCPVRRTCAWARASWPEPDPAAGSAAVSTRQAKFAGSARQARGRLLRAAQQGAVAPRGLSAAAGLEGQADAQARARAVAESLVSDGLLERDGAGNWVIAGTTPNH